MKIHPIKTKLSNGGVIASRVPSFSDDILREGPGLRRSSLFCLALLSGALVLVSCGPKTPLEESFQAISRSQDRVSVMRCPLEQQEQRLKELRKEGWRVSGEAVLTSATRLSDYELKKTAVKKGAGAVLVSETSVASEKGISASSRRVSSKKSLLAQTREGTVKRSSVSEGTPPLPHREAYFLNATLSSPVSQESVPTRIQWNYRVSFLSKL